jgi:hypothetical protein
MQSTVHVPRWQWDSQRQVTEVVSPQMRIDGRHGGPMPFSFQIQVRHYTEHEELTADGQ